MKGLLIVLVAALAVLFSAGDIQACGGYGGGFGGAGFYGGGYGGGCGAGYGGFNQFAYSAPMCNSGFYNSGFYGQGFHGASFYPASYGFKSFAFRNRFVRVNNKVVLVNKFGSRAVGY